MTKTNLFISIFAALSVFVPSRADEARLLRFPATNGREVAFSYAGDLYRVSIDGGVATRLTSDAGYEAFARYSPDGNSLAFTAQYDGNTEVYVMPATGGTPQRVTYTASNPRDDWGDRMGPNNIVMCWTPDGKNIVYRNRLGESFDGQLWMAPVAGGMSTRLPLPEGGFCCFNSDGSKLAFNRVFREFRTWKYYRGGMADDIWIFDMNTHATTNITNTVAQDISPMWIGDEIYYMSDRDRRMNLFVYNTVTGATSKVTDFTEFDVKFASCGGGKVVFENGGWLYVLDPATKLTRRLEVRLSAENKASRPTSREVSDYVTAASASPDGARLCVSARGEVFDVPARHGVTRNVTRTPGVHERNAQWSPDGRRIAFISDESGESELWMAEAAGGERVRLTNTGETYIEDFTWSPDGKRIVFVDSHNASRICLVDVASHATKVLLTDSVWTPDVPAFSPDGAWITYARMAKNEHRYVCLMELASAREYVVTDSWYDSNSPAFSTDGKYLLFASNRDFNPTYSSIEWNFAFNNMEGIYLLMLANDTPDPFLEKDDQVKVETAQNSQKKEPSKSANSTLNSQLSKLKIDTQDLAYRIVKVPIPAGNYGNLACDGKHLWYNKRGEAHVFNLETQKDEVVCKGNLYPTADMHKALVMRGKELFVIDLPTAKATTDKPVDLSNMIADVDYHKEWRQIYDEAWRVYRNGFYLENMHGVDWKAIHDKYAALLPYVNCRLDLTYVIGAMISELAVGHAYVNGGDQGERDHHRIGMLGADLTRDAAGYRITKIYRGAPDRQSLRSPLAQPGLNINEGDIITAIDGMPTANVDNIYQLLADKAERPTELTIGARKVVVKPIADEYPLRHYEWVENNVRYVNEKSGGKVGYLYIPDMGPEGLREFARYYFAQIDKEALIIDDRGNGGGNISPMIIERLLRHPYRMTMYRGSNINGTIPEGTHYGPKVLLINKYSASDGDLFPWSFKENKIGTVIGTRTWGGIIGISGSKPYLDGTDIRTPFFTNYDMRGNWIVENHGVDPDILIDNDPYREFCGEDQQLDKAIEVALEQLKSRTPLPKTPAPRTLDDLLR